MWEYSKNPDHLQAREKGLETEIEGTYDFD